MEQVKFWICIIVLILKVDAFVASTANLTNTFTTAAQKTDLQKILDLFVKEKQNLQAYVAAHEITLHNKIGELELDLNSTKADFHKVTHVLDKEKQDRIQLQQSYDRLMLEFYNVTINYNTLMAKLKTVEARTIRLERENADLLKQNHELESHVHNFSQLLNGVDVQSDHADLLELKRKAGYHSGFTVWYPVSGPTTGTIAFSQIVTNIGGNYVPSTGKFYCSQSGVYYFSMAIYKNYYAKLAYCFMRKNGTTLLYAQSTASSASDGSHTMIVHLNSGDVVDLGGCSGVTYMSMYSSFSGFLLKSD